LDFVYEDLLSKMETLRQLQAVFFRRCAVPHGVSICCGADARTTGRLGAKSPHFSVFHKRAIERSILSSMLADLAL
jgi:hypothetical protein